MSLKLERPTLPSLRSLALPVPKIKPSHILSPISPHNSSFTTHRNFRKTVMADHEADSLTLSPLQLRTPSPTPPPPSPGPSPQARPRARSASVKPSSYIPEAVRNTVKRTSVGSLPTHANRLMPPTKHRFRLLRSRTFEDADGVMWITPRSQNRRGSTSSSCTDRSTPSPPPQISESSILPHISRLSRQRAVLIHDPNNYRVLCLGKVENPQRILRQLPPGSQLHPYKVSRVYGSFDLETVLSTRYAVYTNSAVGLKETALTPINESLLPPPLRSPVTAIPPSS